MQQKISIPVIKFSKITLFFGLRNRPLFQFSIFNFTKTLKTFPSLFESLCCRQRSPDSSRKGRYSLLAGYEVSGRSFALSPAARRDAHIRGTRDKLHDRYRTFTLFPSFSIAYSTLVLFMFYPSSFIHRTWIEHE